MIKDDALSGKGEQWVTENALSGEGDGEDSGGKKTREWVPVEVGVESEVGDQVQVMVLR